ncbi:MAG: hypothetical protein FJ315_07060, partial [SAR202 cluster bacterium]|nr:hypothetical protein [SAR202 cluster bacterium]
MREPDGRQHSFSHDTNGSHARPSDPYDRREALSGGGLGRLLGKADDVLPGGGAGALDDLPGGGSMLDDAPGAGGA